MLERKEYLLRILVVCLGCLHGSLFISGYRLTADDVECQYHAMRGISESWQFIKATAICQGRIVHFIDIIFSLFGSYYSDSKIFRIFYTSIYFVNFALIAKYVSKLAGVRSGFFISLVLFSLHPLDYYHLSPNAYPFKISLPSLLIISSRLALWNSRNVNNENSNIVQLSWLALCFFAMMFSEYAFAFAVALMCAEFLRRVTGRGIENGRWIEASWYWLRHPYIFKDFVLILLFLVSYVGFRFFFPSSYDGNQIPNEFHLLAFLKTLFGHMYGGTSLAAFFRYKSYLGGLIDGLGYANWILLIFAFIGTFIASIIALGVLERAENIRKLAPRYWIMAALALFCAMLVTAPVALTAKYQGWCVNISACIFVDSRLSYLGSGVFLSAVMLGFVACSRVKFTSNLAIIVLLSAALAISSAFTFLNNLRIESDMRQYVSGWDRATKLACATSETLRKIDPVLSKIIEPVPRISFHPEFDIKTYWITYINHRKRHVDCNDNSMQLTDLFPSYELGERMLLNKTGAGLVYLLSGWSSPETWGTWSDGESAELIFPASGKVHSILIEGNALVTPAHPNQDVVVKINDALVFTARLTNPSANLIDISIPETIQEKIVDQGLMRIQFQFPNAVSPKAIGINEDSRKLSMGLQAITLY